MKKTIAALSFSLALTIGLVGCSPSSSEVIVKTDAGNITKDDLYEVLKTSSGATVLESLIEEKLLSTKYKISNGELNKAFNEIKSQYGSDDEFELALTSNGYADEAAFKEQLELSLLQEKATTEGIKTSEKKLKAYYNENKTNYEYVTASHILVSTEEEAIEIKKQLDDGSDFAKLAKEKSTDTTSGEKGGSLGEFTRSEMVTEFAEAAFNQEVGTISNPVKTDYGYHIIKVTKHEQKKYNDIKEQVKKGYLSANAKSIDDVMDKLKKSKNVEIMDKDLKKQIATTVPS
ncbi:peptidylprolyl isomerase [Bacillus sp. Xin]|uniref:peptidylprolyl isomerase n=1 Tax=unclassified Bacillus (in: firmicutes) TaxID=185979 RepID=UPI001574EA54|nr:MULTISPECIES: peptidylprolyl isomerase [unclassified Bacillus (in: firmicutes)]MBC6971823.1 peptidylprolyl isomerase [Bacillus sp. Xin]NSW37972.1 peptidylprolyl isomerase [Bacillus sp. Xin1]